MRPLIPDDDPQQIARIEDRLRRLEQTSNRVIFTPSAVGSLNLGYFDGDNITGVRIDLTGVTASTGGNTYMRLRPNGMTSPYISSVNQRTYAQNSPSYTGVQDVAGGGAYTNAVPGFAIVWTDWGTSANSITATGTFYTPRVGLGRRHWVGKYTNQDIITDGNNRLMGDVYGIWEDSSTVLTSISLVMDAGTFTGRVSVEVIP